MLSGSNEGVDVVITYRNHTISHRTDVESAPGYNAGESLTVIIPK